MTVSIINAINPYGFSVGNVRQLPPVDEAAGIAAGWARAYTLPSQPGNDTPVRYDPDTGLIVDSSGAAIPSLAPWKRRLKPRNIGTSLFAPRSGAFTTSGSGTTWHLAQAVAQQFDAVQLVLCNMSSSVAIPITSAAVSVIADWSTDANRNNSAGTWTAVTFDGGSASSTVPVAAATGRRGYKLSDVIALSSVARTDGGALPILAARHYCSALSTAYSVIGNGGSDVYTNHKTAANGRVRVMRKHDGDAVGTPANLANTTDISQTTIAGVIYYARGQVVSIMAIGDSVTAGYGATLQGTGWLAGVVDALHNSAALAVDSCNLGWPGQTSVFYRLYLADAVAAGIAPDLCFVAGGTQNDTSPTLTAGEITTTKRNAVRACADMFAAGVIPIVYTMCPTNSKAWNASDSLRQAHNADIRSWAARGIPVADFAAVLEGPDNGSGQLTLAAALTSDSTHPNDAGNAAMAPVGAAAITSLVA